MALVKNRSDLLGMLKKHFAYAGGEDRAAVDALLVSKEIGTLEDDAGPIDLNKVWDTIAPRKSFRFPGAEPSADPGIDAVKGIDGIIASKQAPAMSIADMPVRLAKSRYNHKAKQGLTRFENADEAEAVGAAFRFHTLAKHGYARLGDDEKILTKAASAFTNTGGAALIAPQFIQVLSYATEPFGAARTLANIVPMISDMADQPRKTDIFSLSHRLPTGAYTETQNSYDLVKLTAKDAGGIARIPLTLIADNAISIVEDIAATVQEARGIREDKDYFIGDGTSTYGGNVGLVAGLVSGAYIAQATSNTWATQTIADIIGLIGVVENCNTSRLCFVCSRQYFVQVMARLAMSTAAGGLTATEIKGGVVVNGIKADAMFLGFPVVFAQQMPIVSATSQKCLYFGDFQAGSMLGTRNQLDIATSEHAYFTTGELGVRVSVRGCVNICGDGRGGTYGPIVALKTS